MINHLPHRVNFGNGQVHELPSKAAAYYYLVRLSVEGFGLNGAYVQFQDPDTREWFRTGSTILPITERQS